MNIKLAGKLVIGAVVLSVATVELVKKAWKKGTDTVEEYICNLDPKSQENYMLYQADIALMSIAQLRDDLIKRNPKMEPTATAFLMQAVVAHKNLVEHTESAEAYDNFEAVIEECEGELEEKILTTFE